MPFPFHQFEQHVAEAILKRGFSYFKKGRVQEPEEIADGVFEALVEGTDEYRVAITVKNKMVTDAVCSCPYDSSAICKHVVALLFYLQQDMLDLEPVNSKVKKSAKKTAPKTSRKKTVEEQVRDILEKISPVELRNFILELTLQQSSFRREFLARYSYHTGAESKEEYAKQIRAVLRSAAGRSGYIEWNKVREVGKAIYKMADLGEKHRLAKNYKSAFFIGAAILEEMTKALQFADDSDADIGGTIEMALALLSDMSREILPEDIRLLFYNYCMEAFEKNWFEGWDWHLEMLLIAAELAKIEEEAVPVLLQLKMSIRTEFDKKMVEKTEWRMIKKFNGTKEAQAYMQQHLDNPDFRKEAVLHAIKKKDFLSARSLLLEGIKRDSKSYPAVVNEWYELLLKIAKLQKDTNKITEYARFLFLNSYVNKQENYQLLRNSISAEHWNQYVYSLIKDLRNLDRWGSTHTIAEIYIHEQWWDKLMDLLKQDPSIHNIETYQKHLGSEYQDEIIELYGNTIVSNMKSANNRSDYQSVCRYLRRLKKMGGADRCRQLINEFRSIYPQRRALMEELNNV